MGGTVSRGKDNEDLIDKLKEANIIRTEEVERAFRIVDRANYFLPDHRRQAYVDGAWREGQIHLSAPCIYGEALEQLNLAHGLRFLNIGSGTGYFNTVAGMLLGYRGVNHGIEIAPSNVTYAEKCLADFIDTADAVYQREFCAPRFVSGNVFLLAVEQRPGFRPYDRIYCGAKVEGERELSCIRQMLSTDGILVAPVGDSLKRVIRKSESQFEETHVMSVAFAPLQEPSPGLALDVLLPPEAEIPTLQVLCVRFVRSRLSGRIRREHAQLPTPRRAHYPDPSDNSSSDEDGWLDRRPAGGDRGQQSGSGEQEELAVESPDTSSSTSYECVDNLEESGLSTASQQPKSDDLEMSDSGRNSPVPGGDVDQETMDTSMTTDRPPTANQARPKTPDPTAADSTSASPPRAELSGEESDDLAQLRAEHYDLFRILTLRIPPNRLGVFHPPRRSQRHRTQEQDEPDRSATAAGAEEESSPRKPLVPIVTEQDYYYRQEMENLLVQLPLPPCFRAIILQNPL